MIRLTGIEIIDFGRHKYINQELEGNVIALTGNNGLGKTTILQAVELGVTGGIETENNDPLSEWIRKGTSGGKSAKSAQVKLKFVTDSNSKASIERKITKTTTSRELIIEGMDGGPFSSDKKVQQIMLSLLGVDKKALGSTVFLKQGALDAMFGGKTDRREFYTRLLMLGHLPKIADVVDGYRKNVASSIVDLSAVLDEARQAELEAAAEFSTIDAKLNATKDYSDLITMVSRLVFLFGDQTSAHNSVTSELALLGDDPAAKIDVLKMCNDQRSARVSEIIQARLQHSRAQTAWLEAKNKVDAARALRQYQDDLQTADTALNLKIASMDSKVDWEALVTSLQRKADAATTIAGFTAVKVSKAFDVEILKAQLEGATSMVRETTATRDEHLRTVKDLTHDLEMRRNILKEIHEDHSHDARCLVCGASEASMEEGYMTTSMVAIQTELDAASALLDIAVANLKVATDALKAANAEYSLRKSELDTIESRLAAANEILGGDTTPVTDLTDRLMEARVKAAEQSQINADVQRLQSDVTRLTALAGDQPYQTDNKIHELQSLAEAAEAEASAVWNTALDAEQQTLTNAVATAAADISALIAAQSRLQAARDWLARTETELQELCQKKAPHIPDDIYLRGHTMTASIAGEALVKLRERQSEYDSLRGSRESARTAMVATQRRVVDTEAKIEGQQQRIVLAERLTRLRDAFRPTGVSLEYLDYKFGQVASMAADYLAESGADFMVVASENAPLSYDFMRMAPGEAWLGQSRLSGGQKVRLAVSTLRAIHSLVVPNVGLLILDEPTTHLDTDAKLALADMLRRIGAEGGLQILVCDHDPVILDACSSVITIPN